MSSDDVKEIVLGIAEANAVVELMGYIDVGLIDLSHQFFGWDNCVLPLV